MTYQTYGSGSASETERPLGRSMWRGFLGRCPHCGEGRLFQSFSKTADHCDRCEEPFHHHRADDLPAYLVIFIVGHVVVAGFLAVERVTAMTTWEHLAIWTPLTVIASIALLQPVKGAVVGLQWALRMHGFGGHDDSPETHPEA